ncbi:MAG: hypothetical protein JW818_04780 [Pirellulales bacterium]|nr:hypothetical protein [Pirellulales bacterium]
MANRIIRGISVALAWVLLCPAMLRAGIILSFDYTYDTTGFFAQGTAARATLEEAGHFFESILDDDFTAIDSGVNGNYDLLFRRPDTGETTTIMSAHVPADTMIVFVGARDLGTNVLGLAGPGGGSLYGTPEFNDNAISRGEGDGTEYATTGSTATDFARWGGSLAVTTQFSWHADPTRPNTSGKADLFSVVLHELGHVLGIGTSDSWDNLVSSHQFTGTISSGLYGGSVPLDSIDSHWVDGTTSFFYGGGPAQETAMDPVISIGSRKLYTDLDVAGLDDLGWDINPIAEWTPAGSGAFHSVGSWSTGTVPGVRDTVRFAHGGSYTVSFSGSVSNRQAVVEGGTVDLDLGSATYSLNYLVLDGSGSPTTLSIHNGTVRVANEIILTSNTYLEPDSGGTLHLDGTLTGSVIVRAGGTLTGSGYVTTDVTNFGTVSPGDSTGTFIIKDDLTQYASGTLRIELAGDVAGESYDVLAVTDKATLAGELEIILLGGFTPEAGDTFQVLTYGQRSGTFLTITVDGPLGIFPVYQSTSMLLRVVGPGDANGDGVVNALDARALANHWLTAGAGWLGGDFNADGTVDDLDASILAANWSGMVEGDVSVPEPSTFVLLASMAIGVMLLQYKRR